MIKRIDHVEVVASDIECSIQFYTEILGFHLHSRQEMNRPDLREVVYLKLGDTMLELLSVAQSMPQPSDEWRIGVRMFALEVDNMEEEIERLSTKGVQISKPPYTTGPSKRAEIKDPDGVSIELRQWWQHWI